VGDLSSAADVDFQYSQGGDFEEYDGDYGRNYEQDDGYNHESGSDLDINDFVPDSDGNHIDEEKEEKEEKEEVVSDMADDVHLLSFFHIDEQDLVLNGIDPFAPVQVQALVVSMSKRSVTRSAFTVWLEVDDGASTEVIVMKSLFVEKFLRMSPAQYLDSVSHTNMSKQERKEREGKIWMRFFNLCGIFWAKRRKSVTNNSSGSNSTCTGSDIDLNADEQDENEKEPVIEFIDFAQNSPDISESMDIDL